MEDVRCKNCNTMLLKASIFNGAIKCKKCKMIFEYRLFSKVISNLDDPKQKQACKDNEIVPE